MNAEKFTQKTIETINTAQAMAQENGNQYLTPAHLLYALIDQDGGLIGSLLTKMGADCDAMLGELDAEIAKLPRVSGGSGETYASPETSKLLRFAEKAAEKLGDEYISVEHLMLGMFSEGGPAVRKILSDHGVTREGFNTALAKVKTGHAVDGVVDEDDGELLAPVGGVDDLVGAYGGEVAVALVGEDAGAGVDALDAGGDGGGAAVRGLVHVAVEVVIRENGTSDRRDADDVVGQTELLDRLTDEPVGYAVVAAGAVVEHGVGEHFGLFKYNGHYSTSLMLSSFSLISSGVGMWLP